jgi:hypothetical protein
MIILCLHKKNKKEVIFSLINPIEPPSWNDLVVHPVEVSLPVGPPSLEEAMEALPRGKCQHPKAIELVLFELALVGVPRRVIEV